jgi:hypothetical protein
MFVLQDRWSGRYLASGLVLSTDSDEAIAFACADSAARFAARGWCGGGAPLVVELVEAAALRIAV